MTKAIGKSIILMTLCAFLCLFTAACQPAIPRVIFESNGAGTVDTVNAAVIEAEPVVVRAGYDFMGWYETVDFSGERIAFPYSLHFLIQ